MKSDSWVGEVIEREKTDEKVFSSHDKAVETAKICGISKREISNIRKEVSADWERTADQEKEEKKVTDIGFLFKKSTELPKVNKIYSEVSNIPGFPPMSRATLHCINGS